MARYEPLGRKAFISQVGRGLVGIVVLGAAACGDETASTTTAASASTVPPTGGAPSPTATTPATTAAPSTSDSSAAPAGSAIERVNLGFVSAYVVARGTEAAIVDTGVSGSEAAIAESLSAVGLDWGDVGHVILTHLHGDHIGSLGAVMEAASAATGYAGAADIPQITSPRPLTAVGTGDTVFGLDIVSTPGHTPGHVSVFDPMTKALIAGDAINGAGSGLPGAEDAGIAGANPRFTPDMETAGVSIATMAALSPEAIFFGHGEPLLNGAAAALATLAAG